MGALFSFAAIWVAVIVLTGIFCVGEHIADWAKDSPILAGLVMALAGLIDSALRMVRNFFARVFSICKQISWWFYTEGRKHNEH